MLRLQHNALTTPIEEIICAVHSQEGILAELQDIEEAFLRQKSRGEVAKKLGSKYLIFSQGGSRTNFRHRIASLCCDDGSITTNGLKIKDEIVNFYYNLLGVADPLSAKCDVNRLRALLPLKLNDGMHGCLLVDVSKDEIFAIIKKMPANKAPSPDGFTAEFFRATWSIVRDQVVAIVLEFFWSLGCY